MTTLQILTLHKTEVSDISVLKSLTNLKKLNLGQTKVSKRNVVALKKALPNCKIEF